MKQPHEKLKVRHRISFLRIFTVCYRKGYLCINTANYVLELCWLLSTLFTRVFPFQLNDFPLKDWHNSPVYLSTAISLNVVAVRMCEEKATTTKSPTQASALKLFVLLKNNYATMEFWFLSLLSSLSSPLMNLFAGVVKRFWFKGTHI